MDPRKRSWVARRGGVAALLGALLLMPGCTALERWGQDWVDLGAPIGAALVELIRNSLLLAGIPALWQQFFVGLFLILAVLLEQIRNRGGN